MLERDAFPELPADVRAQLIAGFNANNAQRFGGTLGYRLVDVRRGWARVEVESTVPLSNPAEVMHGGASFGLADSAVAAALIGVYGFGSALLTIEMKINYLEPIGVGIGTVSADAAVLRHSRRSAYAEVDVRADGKLVARASTTYMIKPLAAA
jgi:uncharacterized protein (TIGR00369 family)